MRSIIHLPAAQRTHELASRVNMHTCSGEPASLMTHSSEGACVADAVWQEAALLNVHLYPPERPNVCSWTPRGIEAGRLAYHNCCAHWPCDWHTLFACRAGQTRRFQCVCGSALKMGCANPCWHLDLCTPLILAKPSNFKLQALPAIC